MFVTFTHFHLSLVFVGKAGAYYGGAPLRNSTQIVGSYPCREIVARVIVVGAKDGAPFCSNFIPIKGKKMVLG